MPILLSHPVIRENQFYESPQARQPLAFLNRELLHRSMNENPAHRSAAESHKRIDPMVHKLFEPNKSQKLKGKMRKVTISMLLFSAAFDTMLQHMLTVSILSFCVTSVIEVSRTVMR
jgi:hypothetical protein